MRTVLALLLGIAIGIVLFGIVGFAFLAPAPVNALEEYCKGAVDVWLLQQGADPHSPEVAPMLDSIDRDCMADVASGTFPGRAPIAP